MKPTSGIKNDTAIAGATDPLYNIGSREPACYSVVVNAAFCPDTSDYYCIKEDEVKMAEQSLQNRIKIYPNPTAGHPNLLSPTPVYTQISSPDGRIWQRNNDTKLSMESLPSGVYFIRITDLEGRLIKVEQVVKK